MDSRSVAHVLSQIASYLELAGENRYKVRAYQTAARSVLALASDDLRPQLRSGEVAALRGVGPATLKVIREFVESGESSYLEQLRQQMPEGLLELMRVPGMSAERIHKLHAELGVASLGDLEEATGAGRLAKVKGIGPKTAQKIASSIALMKEKGRWLLYAQGMIEARSMLASVRSHPDVTAADIAGSLRRRREVVADIDIVAAAGDPSAVAGSFARLPGLRSATVDDAAASLQFADGTKFHLYFAPPQRFGAALWRATGSERHLEAMQAHLQSRDLMLEGEALRDRARREIETPDEMAFFRALGLDFIEPELREDQGEIDAARTHALPRLLELGDIRGVLHCHSVYSDGKNSIAQMADGARAIGFDYIGISDHSQAAFYAGGLSREQVLEQHDEIDAYNAGAPAVRVLKGVEADILVDGRLDYDEGLLDRFDYVIASIHGRFRMDGPAITERVLRAMDDPHMTILAHPTGRLLLSREPYALDVEAVLQKAAERQVAVEINCDPHRMDLDWSYLKRARELGVTIEIGPDAHSAGSLAWTELGVFMARKGWLGPEHILNAHGADAVIDFAARRRNAK